MPDVHLTTICDVAEVVIHNVPDSPGIAADIFGALGARGYNVELVISSPGKHNRANIAFALREKDVDAAIQLLNDMKSTLQFDDISSRSDIAILTVSWHMLSGQPGSGGRLFSALSKAGINIEAISTSLSSISCVVKVSQIDEAATALRAEFGID
ncbi:MAG: ACT domain-containing protein [candidate division Zixibacteria bacterium]|nr:ACT domain-containing protein [candidate division Zixibacteria bacterium]MBU1471541.1 ACT domain-containing protein [candidate division Zixibacteria bacterium]MBU2626316.1 ACT domain-containing protein [candidate division Zixibacteria bacterium]